DRTNPSLALPRLPSPVAAAAAPQSNPAAGDLLAPLRRRPQPSIPLPRESQGKGREGKGREGRGSAQIHGGISAPSSPDPRPSSREVGHGGPTQPGSSHGRTEMPQTLPSRTTPQPSRTRAGDRGSPVTAMDDCPGSGRTTCSCSSSWTTAYVLDFIFSPFSDLLIHNS
uniref:Uncharacterized protein n=1 Tax=Triticum urartu TaxID=4572 RepID=A0A8R7V8U9_TRIUA